jgi:hypothetical protein
LNTAQAQFVPQELIVRIYNTAAIPRREVRAAERIAEKIFQSARIQFRWRECRTASGPSAEADDLCAEQLQPTEVMARLVVIGGADPSTSVFGYALIDGEAQGGKLATIFADRVTAAALRLHVNRPTLMGRMLAHELGHLLLGSNSHAPRGLMRAWWTDTDLHRVRPRDWEFSERETRTMNAALVLRAGGGTTTPGIRAATSRGREPRT